MSVAVKGDIREMEKVAQTRTNVPVKNLMTVTPTPCVRTLKDPMSAAVLEDTKAMEKIVQLPQLLVLHLVVLTLFVRKMADLILCVSVTLVSKETDTSAQI